MLLSDSHRFLFVHVSKTGGSSVTQALQPYALKRGRALWLRTLRPLGLPRDHRRFRFTKHASLRDAERRIPRAVYATLFKFAFVRNPWDRLVSEYNAVLAKPGHRRHQRVARMGFRAYLLREAPRIVGLQIDMLTDRSGALGVDFVGRFERFDEDLRAVCARIGVTPPAVVPHVNAYAHDPYETFYDDETRAIVARTWGRDIDAFGYGA